MSDNLLQAAPEPTRPSDIPEKFWDSENGAMRVDALLKSYRELERRMSHRLAPPTDASDDEERRRWREMMNIPDSPEGYHVEAKHELCGPDPAINARLHAAGFSCDQVQLVYDLASERLLPLIAEAAQQFEADRQAEKLREHFGGDERFRRVAAQLSAWGRANLPPAVFEALATTSEGVLALERMMQGNEPGLARDAAPPATMDEGELRRMMRDPRYWRQREPEFVKRVTEGFRKLVNG
ncbi:hypothetical protein EJV46_12175 [Roseococcus sp. SYP-B2431]|uniref:capsid assembly protein n=1 Tax=Roseococcus sp. SYP-B2431 TaxID=2496640 RepID=UPI00103F8678|nr:hypothetical protein [Roseococcus sp. SYP-B2431]TCH97966.1 hypothetical protein EJV46_12175 [Roseococcus sp. SYP-B2431]